ncbi:MAG: zinc ribbon domain-containing protein [Phycisphaerales bacterium]
MSITDDLVKLYRVEQQIRALRGRVDNAERYLKAQTRQVDELRSRREARESQARQLGAAAANVENEANAAEERIVKLREQMNSAKTNKEYTALRTELSTIRLQKDKLESQALEEMSRVDEVKAELHEIAAQIAEREKIRQVAEAQLKERRDEIADKLAELEASRRDAAKGIPSETLRDFEQLTEWNEGEAMAEVVEQDRRRMEYSCGACNMTLPIEKLNALLTHGAVTICPSCRRILYVGDELRQEFAERVASR